MRGATAIPRYPISSRQPVRTGFRLLMILLIGMCIALPVCARAEEERTATPSRSGWSSRLGSGVVTGPDYAGSDDYETSAVPSLNASYEDWFFVGFPKSAGFNVIRRERLTAGIALGYGGGHDDEGDLSPLEEVDTGALGNVFADYRFGPVGLSVLFSKALSGDNVGEQVTLGLDSGLPLGRKWILWIGSNIHWNSNEWNEAIYSLSPAEAARLGVTRFDAKGGLSAIGINGSLTCKLGERKSLMGVVGVSRLLNDAEDSPLVEDLGRRTQAMTALFVAYGFR